MSQTPDHSSVQSAGAEPTQDERNFAMLAHLLQFFAGFVPPLVIYLVKRNSRFVAFHAMQALLWQAAYLVIIMLGMMVMFATMFATLIHQHPNAASNNAPPLAFFLGFGALWLVFMIGGFGNLILAIVYSIKAYHGKWSAYPMFGRLAHKIVDA